jgi:hypothetical protein
LLAAGLQGISSNIFWAPAKGIAVLLETAMAEVGVVVGERAVDERALVLITLAVVAPAVVVEVADAPLVATCAEVEVEGPDAVLEDGAAPWDVGEVAGAVGEGELVPTTLAVVAAAVAGEGADARVVVTRAKVGLEGVDAVLEDGGGTTPFMRSRISFIRLNFSSILDIEAQRSATSTMARFDFFFGEGGGDGWIRMERGSDYQLLRS